MGKIIETKIDRFDGGIVNDPRDPREATARIMSNFNTISSPRKMTPYRSSENGDVSASTQTIRNFLIARLYTTPTFALYGLGVVSGTGRAQIYYKDLTTGAANDLDDSDWTGTANQTSPAGATAFSLFVYYPKTGYIYGAQGGSQIWRYDPDGGDAFANTHQALTYTDIGQGVVHSKDDILYIPYFNAAGPTAAIARNNTDTWNNTALSLPTHYMPVCICEYGNYLAIGCAHRDGLSNSRVFLWDRNSSLSTIHESIDWGTGSLVILEEIDGELIGISLKGGSAAAGWFTGIPNGTAPHNDRVLFRKLVGNKAFKFFELAANHASTRNTTQIPSYRQKVDNRLYFQMLIELNGSVRDGVWSIGRSSPDAPLALIHERTSNNNTALLTSDSVRGFFMVGDYLFQSYTTAGTHATTKTDDSTTGFSHNSVYETKTFNGTQYGYDATYYKDLVEVSVMTEYMPAAGQITLAYQTNQNIGTSTWTTIFTNSTNNSISHTANNVESGGTALPKDYKEIAFRILATGGAEVTGLSFKEEVKEKRYVAD